MKAGKVYVAPGGYVSGCTPDLPKKAILRVSTPTSVESVLWKVQPAARRRRSVSLRMVTPHVEALQQRPEIERVHGPFAVRREHDDLRSLERLSHPQPDHVLAAHAAQRLVLQLRALRFRELDQQIAVRGLLAPVEVGVRFQLLHLGLSARQLHLHGCGALGDDLVLRSCRRGRLRLRLVLVDGLVLDLPLLDGLLVALIVGVPANQDLEDLDALVLQLRFQRLLRGLRLLHALVAAIEVFGVQLPERAPQVLLRARDHDAVLEEAARPDRLHDLERVGDPIKDGQVGLHRVPFAGLDVDARRYPLPLELPDRLAARVAQLEDLQAQGKSVHGLADTDVVQAGAVDHGIDALPDAELDLLDARLSGLHVGGAGVVADQQDDQRRPRYPEDAKLPALRNAHVRHVQVESHFILSLAPQWAAPPQARTAARGHA